MEVALHRNADQDVVLKTLHMLEERAPATRSFLENNWRSDWEVVMSFFESLADRPNVEALINSLIDDVAFREMLTPEYSPTDAEAISCDGSMKKLYPCTIDCGDCDFGANWFLSAKQWLSHQPTVAFDRRDTLRLIDQEAEMILSQAANEPHIFQRFLESSLHQGLGRNCLASVLKSAAAHSVSEIQELFANNWRLQGGLAEGQLPRNYVGLALATDTMNSVCARLLTAWQFWQFSLLKWQVCRTVVAITVYRRRFGAIPNDLDVLVTHGYMKAPPREPFSGSVLGYDAVQKIVYEDKNAAGITRKWYVDFL
jgi:hypothetical protein